MKDATLRNNKCRFKYNLKWFYYTYKHIKIKTIITIKET